MDDYHLSDLRRLKQRLLGPDDPAARAAQGQPGTAAVPETHDAMAAADPDRHGFDVSSRLLQHYWNLLWRRWPWAVASFLMVVIGTAAFVFVVEKNTYTAVSEVVINSSWQGGGGVSDQLFGTHEYLSAQALAEMALRKPTLMSAKALLRTWLDGDWVDENMMQKWLEADWVDENIGDGEIDVKKLNNWLENVPFRMTGERPWFAQGSWRKAQGAASGATPALRGESAEQQMRDAYKDEMKEFDALRKKKATFKHLENMVPESFAGVTVMAAPNNVWVQLEAEDRDPHVAAAMVNAVAAAMKRNYDLRRALIARKELIKSWIDGNAKELRQQQQKMHDLRKEGAVDETELANFPLELRDQLALLQEQMIVLKRMRMDFDSARYSREQVEKELATYQETNVSSRLTSMQIELEFNKDQARQRYKANHPKMKELAGREESIKRVGQQIRDGLLPSDLTTIYSIRGQLVTRLQHLNTSKADLERRIVEQDKDVNRIRDKIFKDAKVNEKALQYAELKSKRDVLQTLALSLEKSYRQAIWSERGYQSQGGADGLGASLQVVPAAVPDEDEPSGPARGKIMIFALLTGLIVAFGAALFFEHFDNKIHTPLDVRREGGMGTLGLIERNVVERFVTPEQPQSPIAEEFAKLRNHIRYSSRLSPERRLLVTSPQKGDGKSYICANLAISFAQEGNRVLLIDMDLRKGGAHCLTEVIAPLEDLGPGLAGYLEGEADIASILVRTELDNLDYVACGGPLTNPLKALRSDRMELLLEQAERDFDIVLVDGPPVIRFADSAMIAHAFRGVLMVTRSGRTRDAELLEATGRLRHVSAPLIGTVINYVTRSEAKSYGSRSYYY